MKIRTCYVSNSSSASFVVRCVNEDGKHLLSESQITMLKNNGFKWAGSDANDFHFPVKTLDTVDLMQTKCPLNLYQDVACNDYEVYIWLFKNHIPFIAMIDNRAELWVYKGGDDYEVYQNYAQQYLSVCQYWEDKEYDNEEEIVKNTIIKNFKQYILQSAPYCKRKTVGDVEDTSMYNTIKLMVEHEKVITNLVREKFTKEEWKKISDVIRSIKGNELFKELQKERMK